LGIFDENFVERDVFLAYNLSNFAVFKIRYNAHGGRAVFWANFPNESARIHWKLGKNGRKMLLIAGGARNGKGIFVKFRLLKQLMKKEKNRDYIWN
jgi:hypothetical protein